jgi:hypothetical protein
MHYAYLAQSSPPRVEPGIEKNMRRGEREPSLRSPSPALRVLALGGPCARREVCGLVEIQASPHGLPMLEGVSNFIEEAKNGGTTPSGYTI